jgi:hypothetical protein
MIDIDKNLNISLILKPDSNHFVLKIFLTTASLSIILARYAISMLRHIIPRGRIDVAKKACLLEKYILFMFGVRVPFFLESLD